MNPCINVIENLSVGTGGGINAWMDSHTKVNLAMAKPLWNRLVD
jgi:hypothetical protein